MVRKPLGKGLLVRLSCRATSPRQRQEERELSLRHPKALAPPTASRGLSRRAVPPKGPAGKCKVTLFSSHQTLYIVALYLPDIPWKQSGSGSRRAGGPPGTWD